MKTTDIKKIYSFLGLPASGKGTQADLFAKKHNLTQISIGNLVREAIQSDDPQIDSASIKKLYEAGKPIEDEIIFDLLERKLAEIKTGILFDNLPFSHKQAEWLDREVQKNGWQKPIIVYINISPDSAIKRISKRLYCSKCGATFNGNEEICSKCGVALTHRSDDNPQALKARIGEYLPRLANVLGIYKSTGQVVEINGEQSIEVVTAEIEEKIND